MDVVKCTICVVFLFAFVGILAVDNNSFNCDFDDGFCHWKQEKTDDFDWTRLSGKTPTNSTGPDSDHTSEEGFYVYIETTSEKGGDNKKNFSARLISPQSDPGQYCFSLWYHMYGRHINRLLVSKKEGTNTTELFSKTRQQGKRWILMQIQFDAKDSFQIVIEGKARNHRYTWYGDIAIDDIVMFGSAKCPSECDDPTPEAGFAKSMVFKIGSIVHIKCDTGYDIVGKSTINCLANGSWSDRPICRLKDCKRPAVNSGVIVNTLEGTTYNMTGNLSCAVGFTLIGNTYVTCQSDGNWTTQPHCVINNCSDPTPESGKVFNRNFQYGSVIEVTCIEGYKISGNSSITCQANTTWNNIPVCDLIECETINITNGNFDTTLGTTFGKNATQSCNKGYTLSGDEIVACYEGGWNGTIGTCTVNDTDTNSLVVVYATVPVIVIVLTIVLSFVIWRRKHIYSAKAKDTTNTHGNKTTIQYTKETCNVHGVENQDYVPETSEPMPSDEEYYCITDNYQVKPIDVVYYNTLDITYEIENDVENQYDHTNDAPKSSSDLYSHISRMKSGITEETTYDTTSRQNLGNECSNTKAETENNSYSHLNIKRLNETLKQNPQSTMQEEESEYANTTSENILAVKTDQNDNLHLNEVKMIQNTVESDASSHGDCEYSKVIKRTGNIDNIIQ